MYPAGQIKLDGGVERLARLPIWTVAVGPGASDTVVVAGRLQYSSPLRTVKKLWLAHVGSA